MWGHMYPLVGTGPFATAFHSTRMVCGERDSSAGFCGLVAWCWRLCLRGVGKENHLDIPKECCPGRMRTLDRAHSRERPTFAEEAVGRGRDRPP